MDEAPELQYHIIPAAIDFGPFCRFRSLGIFACVLPFSPSAGQERTQSEAKIVTECGGLRFWY